MASVRRTNLTIFAELAELTNLVGSGHDVGQRRYVTVDGVQRVTLFALLHVAKDSGVTSYWSAGATFRSNSVPFSRVPAPLI